MCVDDNDISQLARILTLKEWKIKDFLLRFFMCYRQENHSSSAAEYRKQNQ